MTVGLTFSPDGVDISILRTSDDDAIWHSVRVQMISGVCPEEADLSIVCADAIQVERANVNPLNARMGKSTLFDMWAILDN